MNLSSLAHWLRMLFPSYRAKVEALELQRREVAFWENQWRGSMFGSAMLSSASIGMPSESLELCMREIDRAEKEGDFLKRRWMLEVERLIEMEESL